MNSKKRPKDVPKKTPSKKVTVKTQKPAKKYPKKLSKHGRQKLLQSVTKRSDPLQSAKPKPKPKPQSSLNKEKVPSIPKKISFKSQSAKEGSSQRPSTSVSKAAPKTQPKSSQNRPSTSVSKVEPKTQPKAVPKPEPIIITPSNKIVKKPPPSVKTSKIDHHTKKIQKKGAQMTDYVKKVQAVKVPPTVVKVTSKQHVDVKITNRLKDNLKEVDKAIEKADKAVDKALKTLEETDLSKKGLTTAVTSATDPVAVFELQCLEAHNAYRRDHGALPLTLNRKLCKDATDWAKTLAQKGVMQHKPNIPHGENIFSSWSSNPNHVVTGKEPVDKWYEEISLHNFTSEPTDLKSGHFTQVVWKGTKEMGVGYAKSRNGQIFVVARYNPPGNYIGNFGTNVLPKGSPVAASPVAAAIEDEETFIQQALKIHNEYRKKHGVPDLKLNRQMCEYAKEWAEHIAKEGKMMHRTDGKYGENIFMMWSSDPSATPTARDVCKKWYDEINDYSFTAESKGKELKAGHFTQMIWKESHQFGIAMVKGKNGKTFVVANYDPKGNFIGQFINNVPRPVK